MTWPADLQNLLTDFYQNKAKLHGLTGVMAVESMQDSQDELQKNRDAESSHVRRTVWGSEENASPGKEDDVRTTVLGDITYQQPQPQQQPATKPGVALPVIAALALAAATGLGGYWIAKDNAEPDTTEETQPAGFNDESVSIGLGRIEDYIKKDNQQ